jgi:hypothetical protein
MKYISVTIGLLLCTSVVNSAEIISTTETASAKEFTVRCDDGKNITITYRYPNESYVVAGRYFNMYRHAVAFGCK